MAPAHDGSIYAQWEELLICHPSVFVNGPNTNTCNGFFLFVFFKNLGDVSTNEAPGDLTPPLTGVNGGCKHANSWLMTADYTL